MSARSWHQCTRTQPRPAILRNTQVTVLALCTAVFCIVQLTRTARPPRYSSHRYVSAKPESTFLSNAPAFPKQHCFLRPSRLCLFAFLIRINTDEDEYGSLVVWNWQRITEAVGEKTFPSATLPITNLKRICLGSIPVFLRGERCCIIREDSVRTAQ